jgi:hypothetical protein
MVANIFLFMSNVTCGLPGTTKRGMSGEMINLKGYVASSGRTLTVTVPAAVAEESHEKPH